MVQSDPHPIAKYRVIGPVSNSPEFQKAFCLQGGVGDGTAGREALRSLVGSADVAGTGTLGTRLGFNGVPWALLYHYEDGAAAIRRKFCGLV